MAGHEGGWILECGGSLPFVALRAKKGGSLRPATPLWGRAIARVGGRTAGPIQSGVATPVGVLPPHSKKNGGLPSSPADAGYAVAGPKKAAVSLELPSLRTAPPSALNACSSFDQQ